MEAAKQIMIRTLKRLISQWEKLESKKPNDVLLNKIEKLKLILKELK